MLNTTMTLSFSHSLHSGKKSFRYSIPKILISLCILAVIAICSFATFSIANRAYEQLNIVRNFDVAGGVYQETKEPAVAVLKDMASESKLVASIMDSNNPYREALTLGISTWLLGIFASFFIACILFIVVRDLINGSAKFSWRMGIKNSK